NTGTATTLANSQAIDTILSTFTFTESTVSTTQSLVVGGQITASDGLVVTGPAEFNGPAIVKALAEFIYTVVFRNEVKFDDKVEFAMSALFSRDTAGLGTIKAGESRVRIE